MKEMTSMFSRDSGQILCAQQKQKQKKKKKKRRKIRLLSP
jgi:hypothetical protein